MLFTSWTFLLIFLPSFMALYGICCAFGRIPAIWSLVVASLVFYGFWAPYLIVLISCSIAFNYGISVAIRRSVLHPQIQSMLLVGGVSANLLALFYYKYVYTLILFSVGHGYLTSLAGMPPIILPLGISFFTFTQIGYLVDCQGGVTKDNGFPEYVLFVTFFPHLIAGPILHNGEMMPQFADHRNYGLRACNLAPGFSLFILGMLKKSLLADTLGANVPSGFSHASSLQIIDGWTTALSYSLQLYFDFSGYTDMAIGLAIMFNVHFPPNFNSPYKARNIIEFWQRWHMSLTRFLTQYLYSPIAMGLRRQRMAKGKPMTRKVLETPALFAIMVAFPTILTMIMAGIWHGAGMQFLVFGLLHGLYLTINHGWRMFGPRSPKGAPKSESNARIVLSMAVTYLAVLVGQVFFRAASCAQAVQILAAMLGAHGVEHLAHPGRHIKVVDGASNLKLLFSHTAIVGAITRQRLTVLSEIVAAFLICWLLPNTQQIMAVAKPVLGDPPPPAPRLLLWQPNLPWAIIMALATVLALLSLGGTTEFLYFQF